MAGLVAALLGAAALELFSWLRGVRAGGAWGVLAFALVMGAAGWLATVLLRGLGHRSARLVAFLGLLIGLVVLLVTLPRAAETAWALVIVPLLGGASFAAAHALVQLAESIPAEED